MKTQIPEEINIACAERLGWTEIYMAHAGYEAPVDTLKGVLPGSTNAYSIPNFHGSLDAAMHLVEKAREMGWMFSVDNRVDCWSARFDQYDRQQSCYTQWTADHETIPSAAICLAFLKLPLPCPPPYTTHQKL